MNFQTWTYLFIDRTSRSSASRKVSPNLPGQYWGAFFPRCQHTSEHCLCHPICPGSTGCIQRLRDEDGFQGCPRRPGTQSGRVKDTLHPALCRRSLWPGLPILCAAQFIRRRIAMEVHPLVHSGAGWCLTEELVIITPKGFGLIHRRVCVFDQRIHTLAIVRVNTDTDADGDL